MPRHHLLPVLLLSAVAAAGCNSSQPAMPPPKPAEVVVSHAFEKKVIDSEEFQGKTKAEKAVDIRARVSGYLDKVFVAREDELVDGKKPPVREGSYVKQGQVLFILQEKPFRDALTQAEKNYDLLVTQRDFNKRNAERVASSGAGSSPADVDNAETAYRTSESQAAAAKAAVEIAKQNLEWATIRAPFDGRVGRRMVDRGYDVKGDDTILTSIVSLNPLYVDFDIDERTYLRLVHYYEGQGINPSRKIDAEVDMGLSDEKDFPHHGKIDFIDNGLDANSASVWLRGRFANPEMMLMPGLYARVRLPIGAAHPAVLIPEQALATDQGQKFVWVLDKDDHATYRLIQLGAQHGALRVVTGGIKPGERVIVSGLQRVRNDPKKGYAEVKVLYELDTVVSAAAWLAQPW